MNKTFSFVTLLAVAGALVTTQAKPDTPSQPQSPSSHRVQHVKTKADLEKYLAEKKAKVIDFSTTWCGACKWMTPVVEHASNKYGDDVTFLQVDPDVKELEYVKTKYDIQAYPTVVVLNKDNKEVSRQRGTTDEGTLHSMHIAKTGVQPKADAKMPEATPAKTKMVKPEPKKEEVKPEPAKAAAQNDKAPEKVAPAKATEAGGWEKYVPGKDKRPNRSSNWKKYPRKRQAKQSCPA